MADFNAMAFRIFGYADADPAARPGFSAYAPTWEAALADATAYRADWPMLRTWRIVDNSQEPRDA